MARVREKQGPGARASGPRGAYARLLGRIDQVSAWLLIGIMATLVLLVTLQVFYRYVLASTIVFADEISRLCFVWVIFLAIPHGVRLGAHVGIDLLLLRLPPGVVTAINRMTSAIGAVLMLTVAALSVEVARASWDQLLPTVELTAASFYVAVVLGAGHSALHLIARAWYGGQPTRPADAA